MTPTLFDTPTKYAPDFERAWQAYRYPRCSKADGFKAWNQTANVRPIIDLLIFAIEEYLIDIRKRKQLQLHFATFLRRCMFEAYAEEAKLRKRIADHPELIPKPRASFTASQHSAPEAATSLKPWKEIIAASRRAE